MRKPNIIITAFVRLKIKISRRLERVAIFPPRATTAETGEKKKLEKDKMQYMRVCMYVHK